MITLQGCHELKECIKPYCVHVCCWQAMQHFTITVKVCYYAYITLILTWMFSLMLMFCYYLFHDNNSMRHKKEIEFSLALAVVPVRLTELLQALMTLVWHLCFLLFHSPSSIFLLSALCPPNSWPGACSGPGKPVHQVRERVHGPTQARPFTFYSSVNHPTTKVNRRVRTANPHATH